MARMFTLTILAKGRHERFSWIVKESSVEIEENTRVVNGFGIDERHVFWYT